MAKALLITSFLIASGGVAASAHVAQRGVVADQFTTFEHSGGCRKNSPPGECCHAGSKPLHCHK